MHRGVWGGLALGYMEGCVESFTGGFCRWVNRMLCGGMQSWGNIGTFGIHYNKHASEDDIMCSCTLSRYTRAEKVDQHPIRASKCNSLSL